MVPATPLVSAQVLREDKEEWANVQVRGVVVDVVDDFLIMVYYLLLLLLIIIIITYYLVFIINFGECNSNYNSRVVDFLVFKESWLTCYHCNNELGGH